MRRTTTLLNERVLIFAVVAALRMYVMNQKSIGCTLVQLVE